MNDLATKIQLTALVIAIIMFCFPTLFNLLEIEATENIRFWSMLTLLISLLIVLACTFWRIWI